MKVILIETIPLFVKLELITFSGSHKRFLYILFILNQNLEVNKKWNYTTKITPSYVCMRTRILQRNRNENNDDNTDSSRDCNRQRRCMEADTKSINEFPSIRYGAAYVLGVYYLRIGSTKSNDRRRNRETRNFVSAPLARDEEWLPACLGKSWNEFRGAALPPDSGGGSK